MYGWEQFDRYKFKPVYDSPANKWPELQEGLTKQTA